MFISSVRKSAKKSDGHSSTPLIYFWEDIVLKFMPKQCQSTRSSSPAWIPKIRFCKNWVPIHCFCFLLMCILAPRLLYLPSELKPCTSVVPWLLQPLLLESCQDVLWDLGMCWAPDLRTMLQTMYGCCTLYSFLRGIYLSVSCPEIQSNTFLPFKNYKCSWKCPWIVVVSCSLWPHAK